MHNVVQPAFIRLPSTANALVILLDFRQNLLLFMHPRKEIFGTDLGQLPKVDGDFLGV